MKKGLWVLLGMGLCAGIFLVGLFWVGASSDQQTKSAAPASSSSTASQPAKVHHQTAASSSSESVSSPKRVAQTAPTTKSVKPLNSELERTLSDVADQKAMEDSETINNHEITYSRFYQSGQQWYWELTSDKRGTIEKGRILSNQAKTDGMTWHLNMRSVTHNGQLYTLKFVGAEDYMYSIETSFQSLKGLYHYGDNDTDQLADALSPYSSTATEEADTQNNDEVTYSKFFETADGWHWRLWSDERGTIEEARVQTREDTGDGDSKLTMMSIKTTPGQTYKLYLTNYGDDEYSVETSFQHIKGDYEVD